MVDLSKILVKNKKGWLAFTPNKWRFVAKGKTLKEVLEKAKGKGIKNPSVLKAAPVKNLLVG